MWLIKQFKRSEMHWLKTLSEQLRNPHDGGKKDKIIFVEEFSAKQGKFYLSNIFWSNHKNSRGLQKVSTRLKWKRLKQAMFSDNKRCYRVIIRPFSSIAEFNVS